MVLDLPTGLLLFNKFKVKVCFHSKSKQTLSQTMCVKLADVLKPTMTVPVRPSSRSSSFLPSRRSENMSLMGVFPV